MAEIRRVPIIVLLKFREEARAQGMTLDEYCDSLMEQLGVQEVPESQVRRPVGIVGTRHHKMTGEVCEIPGIYRPECHWHNMQLPMAKGLEFPPCFLNEEGELGVSSEGTFPLRDVHVTNWHLVEQRDIEVDPELRHHFGLDGDSSTTNGRA